MSIGDPEERSASFARAYGGMLTMIAYDGRSGQFGQLSGKFDADDGYDVDGIWQGRAPFRGMSKLLIVIEGCAAPDSGFRVFSAKRPTGSFAAERGYGLDGACASCRYEAGYGRDDEQQKRDAQHN
jgi:hypothetical protein